MNLIFRSLHILILGFVSFFFLLFTVKLKEKKNLHRLKINKKFTRTTIKKKHKHELFKLNFYYLNKN